MHFLILSLVLLHPSLPFATPSVIEKPNILLFLTDDQDVALHGMVPMERVQHLLGRDGATFTNAFTNSPLCCPSRATLLSGMYAHNHRSFNNSLNGGCNGAYWQNKIEPRTLPLLLQQNGRYHTFFAGKYLNQYQGEHVPKGWNEFYGLHGNSRYYNYTLRENAQNVSYTDEYLTDLLKNKTLQFLNARREQKEKRPFFVMVAPPAPHEPFTAAERHEGIFKDIKALRTPNFNHLSQSLDKHWLIAHADRQIKPKTLALMDTYFRRRWESLLAVDEMVEAVIKSLQKQGELERTYIIYTSDNGFHVGQFAQPYDKRQPYETDIRVPLLIRGPSIKSGIEINAPAALVDILPTILEWAKIPAAVATVDGRSLHAFLMNAPNYDALLDQQYRRSILIEHWGEGNDDTYNAECPWQRKDHFAGCIPDAECRCQDVRNNTYACIRHFRYATNRLYCEFRDTENFVEAYDLNDDPYQMTNLGYELLPIERALYSLALANLTRCVGSTCDDVII